MSDLELFVVIGGAGMTLLATLLVIKNCWHSVGQSQALVINRMHGDPRVALTGVLVLPIVHKAERIDLSVRQVEISRRGNEGVICRDNIRADVKVTFFVRVNDVVEDILRVARTVGCKRASDQAAIEELFTAKFAEAIKMVAKQLDFEELYSRRERFKDEIIQVIGKDLNGFVLDDAAVDFLEQTPLEALDPNNILDAQGIKKILAGAAKIPRHHRRPLQDELARLGLLDVRVATEVSCDVAPGRARLVVALDGDVDAAVARLPASVPRTVIAAAGAGELSCRDGRATFRWTQIDVTEDQLIAGARLVHALREDDHAYR